MVLLTGATGYLGTRVLALLVSQGADVTALAHDRPSGAVPGVRWARGDVRDLPSLDAAVSGADSVIHLVAVIRQRGEASFEAINVRGTANVVEAAAKAGVRRLVHCSALGAMNNPRYPYAHSKWLGEEAVRQSGIPFVILRPSVLFGPGFGFVDRLVQSVRMSPPPLVPLPGGGKARFSPIAADDVARCLVQVLDEDTFSGETIEIGGPEQLSYTAMMRQVMATMGIRRRGIPVPMGILRLVVPIMARVMPDPPVTPVELGQLDFDNIVPPDAVERRFGFATQRFADGIAYLRDGSRR